MINFLVNINRYAPFRIGLSAYIHLSNHIQYKNVIIKNNNPY